MEGLENIEAFIESLDTSLANLKHELEPVISQGLEDVISKCSSPQEKVKIYHSHLYTVISILFAYIKVLGIKTENHPIMKELTRVKSSMKAMKDLEASLARKEDETSKSVTSANEFLQRTLGTNGGAAAPDNLKSPAISSANFKGKHTKFESEEEPVAASPKAPKTTKKAPNKVTKPKRGKR